MHEKVRKNSTHFTKMRIALAKLYEKGVYSVY